MQVFGLVGNPVGHSRSPAMHEAAFAALGLEARYVTFEPEPTALGRAIDGAAALGLAGLNVTVPFKRDVLAHVDPDPLAARIGAVNTVDFAPDGDPTARPRGHNTDAEGAVRALRERGVPIEGRTAVVVGAGGAGRAIAVGLLEAGASVHVANRTVSRAESLAADLGSDAPGDTGSSPHPVQAHGLEALPTLLADADLLINATTVGMDEDASPVPAEALHAELAVMDAVYSPLETRLLRDASAAGARTVDGGWMLLYQGAAALEHWLDVAAPVEAMAGALRPALE